MGVLNGVQKGTKKLSLGHSAARGSFEVMVISRIEVKIGIAHTLGRALANSEREIPTQTDIIAIMIIPYTTRTGPPEFMPVTRAVDIPNHEFVKEKPSPRTDQTEKFRFISWT